MTNAGGINPEGAQQEVIRVARELGIRGLKVAVVTGDNILYRIDQLMEQGVSFEHMETGESLETVRDRLLLPTCIWASVPSSKRCVRGPTSW